MTTFQPVSPRRLTGAEEAELVEAVKQLQSAEADVASLMSKRDQLIADVVQAGARVSDVADVLNMSRNAVYDAIKRADRAD
jgi:DNA-binding NarL/FixJ family response regulator